MHNFRRAECLKCLNGPALELAAKRLRGRKHVWATPCAKPQAADDIAVRLHRKGNSHALIVDLHPRRRIFKVAGVIGARKQLPYALAVGVVCHAACPGAIARSLATASL